MNVNLQFSKKLNEIKYAICLNESQGSHRHII